MNATGLRQRRRRPHENVHENEHENEHENHRIMNIDENSDIDETDLDLDDLAGANGVAPNINNINNRRHGHRMNHTAGPAAARNTVARNTAWTVSRVYCLVSAVLAALAVLVAPQPSLLVQIQQNQHEKQQRMPYAVLMESSSSASQAANVWLDSVTSTGSSSTSDSTYDADSSSTSSSVAVQAFWDWLDDTTKTSTSTRSAASTSAAAAAWEAENKEHHGGGGDTSSSSSSGSDDDDLEDALLPPWLYRWWDNTSTNANTKHPETSSNSASLKKTGFFWWQSDDETSSSKSSSRKHSTQASTGRTTSHSTGNSKRSSTNTRSIRNFLEWCWSLWMSLLQSWLDPAFFCLSTTTASATVSTSTSAFSYSYTTCFFKTVTDLVDKILTSTVRLLCIANWLLAVTYQLHAAVAIWFLGNAYSNSGNGSNGNGSNGNGNNNNNIPDNNNLMDAVPPTANTNANTTSSTVTRTERLGGFLLFKLLLISAVVAPDTLDLLILLSWYTLLSFLRSLALLCSAATAQHVQTVLSGQQQPQQQQQQQQHATTDGVHHNHNGQNTTTTQQQRQQQQQHSSGVLHLLVAVLVTDCIAAASCVALFHGAGWGMVVLLTTDCVQLLVDCVCFILQHTAQVLEGQHVLLIGQLEEERVVLLQQVQQQQGERNTSAAVDMQQQQQQQQQDEGQEEASLREHDDDEGQLDHDFARSEQQQQQHDVQHDVHELDRRVQVLEQLHARRMEILDSTIFGLQLLTHALTVGHFLHIWSLHGVQFTLIDGVLALHLHSALSSASKKIAERRNLYRIARDLDGLFDDASELDLRKASVTGDVCCICLGTMSTGNVKKVGCGHLYHTTCLREVVERARSIEAARCPLCRASVLDGRQQGSTGGGSRNSNSGNNNNNNSGPGVANNNNANADNEQARRNNIALQARDAANNNNQGGGGEHALFRFSTEGIFPAWLPLPAFSFEVVRRPPAVPEPVVVNMNTNNDAGNLVAVDDENTGNMNVAPENIPAAAGPQQQRSLLRRLLVLAGAIPMSPEEEAAALEQLVDMFPQYDRADLLRGLRERGSAEGVAEDVLTGGFTAIPRGAVNWQGPPMER